MFQPANNRLRKHGKSPLALAKLDVELPLRGGRRTNRHLRGEPVEDQPPRDGQRPSHVALDLPEATRFRSIHLAGARGAASSGRSPDFLRNAGRRRVYLIPLFAVRFPHSNLLARPCHNSRASPAATPCPPV